MTPGADVNTILLSRYRILPPNHFTSKGSLKPHIFRGTCCTWSPHNAEIQSFLGYLTSHVQHKTTANIIPITFYVFEDFTRPYTLTLLSYIASVHLVTVKFKVPNEASRHAVIDAITSTSQAKHVTFGTLLQTSTHVTKKKTRKEKLKSLLKPVHSLQDQPKISPFQDHEVQKITPFHEHSHPLEPFQDHLMSEIAPFQDHSTTKDVLDIVSLKKVFPKLFDTTGNMLECTPSA